MMRITTGCLIGFIAMALLAGCSGNAPKGSLEENFLDYNEMEAVSFSLYGNIKCTECSTDAENILGIEIEVRLANNPINIMAVQLADGLGYFQMEGLRAPPEAELEVKALMRTSSSSRTSRMVTGSTYVPDDEDGTTMITLDFTSNANP
jgi:hypothetical protein